MFGLVLAALSTVWLWLTTNQLAAGLALTAIAFYVLVYTLILKRRTSQNIVWGGAAGCMPVVIGWAAVTGTVGWPALVMFGVIFFWTPPHFWALAMRYRDDYAAAGVPMLPVVATPGAGVAADRRLRVGDGGVVAAAGARRRPGSTRWSPCAVGACFLFRAHRLHAGVVAGREVAPMTLFHLSNMYLCGLFAAIAVDAAVGLPVLGGLPVLTPDSRPRCERTRRSVRLTHPNAAFAPAGPRVYAAGIIPFGSMTYFLAAPLSNSW